MIFSVFLTRMISMMLYLFTTDLDDSEKRIVESANKNGLDIKIFIFSDLYFSENKLYTGQEKRLVEIGRGDKILVRWPWSSTADMRNYLVLIHFLLMVYPQQVYFDRNCLIKNTPFYDDKLFHSYFYSQIKIPTPAIWFAQNLDLLKSLEITYPAVLKKRMSSRGRGNFLVNSYDEIVVIIAGEDISEYVIQEKVDAAHDWRVMVFDKKVLGAIDRDMHVREESRLVVKGAAVVDKIPDSIKNDCLKLVTNLQADLVGIDILLDKKGNYFFIEANLCPQFTRFEDATGISIADLMIKALI